MLLPIGTECRWLVVMVSPTSPVHSYDTPVVMGCCQASWDAEESSLRAGAKPLWARGGMQGGCFGVGASCHQAKEGTLFDFVSLLLTQLNEKGWMIQQLIQPLPALAVVFPCRFLPPPLLFSSRKSQLALIPSGPRQLDLQCGYCRAQGSSWSRSVLFATTKSWWLSPTVGLLRCCGHSPAGALQTTWGFPRPSTASWGEPGSFMPLCIGLNPLGSLPALFCGAESTIRCQK